MPQQSNSPYELFTDGSKTKHGVGFDVNSIKLKKWKTLPNVMSIPATELFEVPVGVGV